MTALAKFAFVYAVALAAAIAAPQCGTEKQGSCYHDSSKVIHHTIVTNASECCNACFRNRKCTSYTAWTDENSSLNCNLFQGQPESTSGSNCVSGTPANRPKLPNFIFVFPDTLRAESFGSYGNPLNVTPNLDKFAAEGVRFNQAHVMHTQCSPSRNTMVTGRYMHLLGHRTQTHLVQEYEPNYLRVLKEAGYHVQYHGKNDMLSAMSFNLSVSNWTGSIGYASGSNPFKYGEAGYYSFLRTGSTVNASDPSNGDTQGVMDALDFLQNSPPEPFVLFIPSRGAHPPYGAPAPFNDLFSADEVKEKIKLRPRNIAAKPTYMGNDDGIPHYRNLTWLEDDFFYEVQAAYLNQIAYTDWLFGELMAGLDKTDLGERTSVFFSSDHGDFGGDYGLVEKWPGSMSDVLTRVPLIAKVPGGSRGTVIEGPVQTADIFETMLDMADVDVDFVRFGQSLVPQLHGQADDLSRTVYSEGGFYFTNEQMIEANECLSGGPKADYYPRGLEESQPNGSPRAVMLRNLTAKLVYRPTGVSELYDLVKDPLELANVFTHPDYAMLRAALMQNLTDWMVLTSDVTPVVTDSRGPPKYPHPVPAECVLQPLPDESVVPEDPWDYLKVNGVH